VTFLILGKSLIPGLVEPAITRWLMMVAASPGLVSCEHRMYPYNHAAIKLTGAILLEAQVVLKGSSKASTKRYFTSFG